MINSIFVIAGINVPLLIGDDKLRFCDKTRNEQTKQQRAFYFNLLKLNIIEFGTHFIECLSSHL